MEIELQKIKTLIIDAKLEEALKLALKEFPNQYQKEIELLIARNSKYKQKFNKGTVTQDDYQKEWTRFTDSLLDIIERVQNKETFINTKNNTPDISKNTETSFISSDRIKIYGVHDVDFLYNIGDKVEFKKENLDYHFPDFVEISSDMHGIHFRSRTNNKYYKQLNYFQGSFKDMEHINWHEEGKGNEFFVGQYDIDQDGVDEIFIGVNNTIDHDFECQVQINFFKFHPPFFGRDCGRSENWKFLGAIESDWSNTQPEICFEKNSVMIIHHYRGFFSEWYYVKDRFVQLE